VSEMVLTIQRTLSSEAVVIVVGVAAAVLLLVHLVRRELREMSPPGLRYLVPGAALTASFLALATLRFLTLGR